MKHPESHHSDPIKSIDSVFELAFGTQEEMAKQTPSEVTANLKILGCDTEAGWQCLQSLLRETQGQLRLAAAREERIKAQSERTNSAGTSSGDQVSLIDQIKAMLAMSGGQAAVFARKAESMSQQDLESLRDQLLRTAARAAKKPQDER